MGFQPSKTPAARVIYEGKTSKLSETFTALDFLARLVTHIPGRGEQMVRYYGFYSNKSRGMRKKEEQEKQDGNNPDSVQVIVDSNIGRKKFRKNWARLIQKIYHVNPLLCPKCNGEMRIISFIEDEAAIKKVLIHLNLWLPDNHDHPPGSIMLQVQPQRSFEWWEAVNQVSDLEYVDDSMQKPYEDDFSQQTPYENWDIIWRNLYLLLPTLYAMRKFNYRLNHCLFINALALFLPYEIFSL
ncbi:MAG: transposase [Desulfitobacteriia bacterium]